MAAAPARADRDRVPARPLPLAYLAFAAVTPLVLLGGLGVILWSAAGPTSSARIGASAPDFTLADLDGNRVSLAELRGRPVIVNFWASWCPPCVEEFPMLNAAVEQHADEGLVVIGIVNRDRSEAAREFMDRMGATWPAAMDPGRQVAARYGVRGPPETFFIDRNGVVVGRQIGPLTPTDLEHKLASILEGAN